MTREFLKDEKDYVEGLKASRVDWQRMNGKLEMIDVEGSGQQWQADLVLLAMGFLGPESYLGESLGVAFDKCSNFRAEHGDFKTSVDGIFAAGDCRRGQSLVVWAINEGRGAARSIDQYLMGVTDLPAPGLSMGIVTG